MEVPSRVARVPTPVVGPGGGPSGDDTVSLYRGLTVYGVPGSTGVRTLVPFVYCPIERLRSHEPSLVPRLSLSFSVF